VVPCCWRNSLQSGPIPLAGDNRQTSPPISGPPPSQRRIWGKCGADPSSAQLDQLSLRFPARPTAINWPGTELSRPQVDQLLAKAPFVAATAGADANRLLGVELVLDWLDAQPGRTWQERWRASGTEDHDARDWRSLPESWLAGTAPEASRRRLLCLGPGLLSLMGADVLRPSIGWLLRARSPLRLDLDLARTRDPVAFARLHEHAAASPVGPGTTRMSMHRIAVLTIAKGGMVADITVGDCLELLELAATVARLTPGHSPYFYQLLYSLGSLDEGAAPTVRALNPNRQLSVEQLIDQYRLECQPVRDLLVDYLRERQSSLDHSSLRNLARVLGRLFWQDLEHHQPGIDSLHLSPSVAAAWKQRLSIKTTRREGSDVEVRAQRLGVTSYLTTIRAFYLDIAQWATDDPSRWGPWAVPCPIRSSDLSLRKESTQRKSRMDARTRERLPALSGLVATLSLQRRASAELLNAARLTAPGDLFSADGQELRRSVVGRTASPANVWTEPTDGGQRRNLALEEYRAFWTWACVEVLRHTGIRIEELCELTHSSLVQYTLPTTGELVPLLHIAPSKTDTERLLVINPDLADVLSAIVIRVRHDNGAIPLVTAYDPHERIFNPPLPLLFQRPVGTENRELGITGVRRLFQAAVHVTGTDGQPVQFAAHDLRRIFITDAVMNGMPPHIAQLIVGHRNINTTMGYKAVYPEEAINGHRAFIARRRALRPSDEYRTPTDTEWEEFLGHFEKRKVALGTCGRAFGTNCVHEHSCIRCPMLRPDPAQRQRLTAIHDNLVNRITEAQNNGWLGELEGLIISLAATKQKITQLDTTTAPTDPQTPAFLGIPTPRRPENTTT
jgi:integrase